MLRFSTLRVISVIKLNLVGPTMRGQNSSKQVKKCKFFCSSGFLNSLIPFRGYDLEM